MTSVGSTLEPCDHIIISGKIINDLSFSFIAPLQAKNYINHDILIFGTSSPVTPFLPLKLVHAACLPCSVVATRRRSIPASIKQRRRVSYSTSLTFYYPFQKRWQK